jgi:predicted aminopeptidase
LPAARVALAGLVLLAASGCQTLGYYAQAVTGQMQIWRESTPAAKILQDPAADAELRARLQRALAIRDFATRELALPDNGSYRSYAALGRAFVVWNVFATEEFSLRPRQWCFPIAGCVAYRGYFSQSRAQGFADRLRGENMDVFVAGVPAYSTLGWFDDPLLDTFLRYPEPELARLIFHELAHQVVYVSGDTAFNESFATAVELEGIERWLAAEGTASQRQAYDAMRVYRQGFVDLVADYRRRLEALYLQNLPDHEKRSRKAATLADMKAAYLTLKQAWGGFAGYDRFFAGELTNAHFVPVVSYTELVPEFRRLFAASGSDFERYYAQVKALAALEPQARRVRLQAPDGGGR